MNVELGLKRITWIVSGIGLVILIGGWLCGDYRYKLRKIEYKKILEKFEQEKRKEAMSKYLQSKRKRQY